MIVTGNHFVRKIWQQGSGGQWTSCVSKLLMLPHKMGPTIFCGLKLQWRGKIPKGAARIPTFSPIMLLKSFYLFLSTFVAIDPDKVFFKQLEFRRVRVFKINNLNFIHPAALWKKKKHIIFDSSRNWILIVSSIILRTDIIVSIGKCRYVYEENEIWYWGPII